MPPSFPSQVTDRFEVLRPLGSGGRGEVFQVRRKEDGRMLALKTLPDEDSESARLLREEVTLLLRLSHPNLVRVEDYFEGPPPAYAMELVEGRTLTEALAHASVDDVLKVFVDCCRGLHYLHARGLLHRDLKPTNIMVSKDGAAKILDFGLPGLGTPAYWPAEAKAGRYDAQSDLFALGLSFQESLKKRAGLPDFFLELLARLVKEDPAERPSSALSLVKFLNRHVTHAFELSPDEATRTILAKVPWVPRPEEERFRVLELKARILMLTGPTGAGRSRFLEEMAWRRKLAGRPTMIQADLHRKSEVDLKALQLALRATLRHPGRDTDHLILIEYDSDLASETLKAWVEGLMAREDAHVLTLADLPRPESLEFVRRASEDAPLSEKDAEEIAASSGGRPLLLVEAIRQKLSAPGAGAKIPKTLADACAVRVGLLDDLSQKLLTLVVAADGTAGLEEIASAWDGSEDAFQDALLALRSQGLVGEIDETGSLQLAHRGLLAAYRETLGSEALSRASRVWMESLAHSTPEPAAVPQAPRLVLHALACGETGVARRWSRGAADFLFNSRRFSEIIELAARLLPVCKERMERVVLLGNLASSLYRLGRYEESLKAFDDWYTTKGDDETKVETVKHRLFTGQVLFAKGSAETARERLLEVLKTGDPEKHPALRSYYARAHALLATLFEQAERWEEAETHLQGAQPLAKDSPLLKADIENQWGLLDQARGRYAEARSHFETAVRSAVAIDNAQAEAIAWNNLGMLDRERGDFGRGLRFMDRAVELAREGGETLQLARYRQNRALLLKDLARFPEAVSEMTSAGDVLFVYGNDEDRRLSDVHLAGVESLTLNEPARGLSLGELASRDGPRFRAWEVLARLAEKPGPAEKPESELAGAIQAIVTLDSPLLRAELFSRLSEMLKQAGLEGLAGRVSDRARSEIETVYQNLPEDILWTIRKPAA